MWYHQLAFLLDVLHNESNSVKHKDLTVGIELHYFNFFGAIVAMNLSKLKDAEIWSSLDVESMPTPCVMSKHVL